ncbi:MAG: hypothetical protein JXQ81_10815 [Desulfuromonadales bacterium]|nr:hypothetical protein [Desulfuromonadales bacterium]MBN2792989.1 hypothetical protein [Desulfuromonadales bacterium]
MWYSATKVGIMEIDMDHSNVDTMLQLYFAGRTPETYLENIIDGLIRHFPHEENVISRLGREFPSEHKVEHQRLSGFLRDMIAAWQAGTKDGKELAEEVRDLLLIHVVEFDVKLNSGANS